MDTLYWFYIQSKESRDVDKVGNFIKQIKESGSKVKLRMAVIQQLLQQDIISTAEYDELMRYEDEQYRKDDDSSLKNKSGIEVSTKSETSSVSQPDDIKVS